MMKVLMCLVFAFGIILPISTFGQDLHEQVVAVYNFTPSNLSKDQQKALFPVLDKFFDDVKQNKEKYLEPLRNELRRNDNNPYFYFDGGLLLNEMSKSDADYQLAADALVKVNLKEVPQEVYLGHLLNLSKKGANVIPATLHILDDTTFIAYISQHMLMLDYGDALKFILPRYSSELYMKQLILKYQSITSVEKRLTCLDLFIYANCCEADTFIRSLNSDNTQPKKIRQKVAKILRQTNLSQKDNPTKYKHYFEERKAILTRISDEAIDELDAVTMKMRENYSCKKL